MDIFELGILDNTAINQSDDVSFDPNNSESDPETGYLADADNFSFPESGDNTNYINAVDDSTIDAGVVEDNFMVVNTYDGGDGDSYQFEIAQTGSYDVELGDLEANLDLSIGDETENIIYTSSESGNESEYIAADFGSGTYTAYITGSEDVETGYSFSITQLSAGEETEGGGEPIISEGDTVYRFLETEAQTQFYTTSEVERDSIIANLPNYEYEGESFIGAPNPEENEIAEVVPVYRLFNTDTGVHLYTASQIERDAVTDNLPNYEYEGIAYHGYESQQEDTVPLYRFYNSSLDAHFYTPSTAEKDEFLADSNYQPEGGESGIAFYVEPVADI